jgi:hypothetical protein
MKSLKRILLPLLNIGAMFLTSCTGLAQIRDEKPDNRLVASALRPQGDTVVFGNIEGFSILIPRQATPQEKYSAAMLTDYLGRMFNVKLQVVQEPRVAKGKIISVGNTAAAAAAGIRADAREQAYKLAVSDGNLYVLGGTRGPIYGVIALLEEDLGCRWYAIDDAPVIPVHSKDQLPVVPRAYAPPFEIRDILYIDTFHHTKWQSFNRLQTIGRTYKMTQEMGGGLATYTPKFAGHSYAKLVPAKRYFADHPEYFPLLDGKRHPSEHGNGQLCYTSQGVVPVIAKQIRADLAKNPGARIYAVCANDNVNDNCECRVCQEIIKTDGISGAQLYLANAVAAKLAVEYPDIRIHTFAYNNSQKAPTNVKPGPNTVVYYAPIRQRSNPISMLLPIGDIGQIKEELAEWHKVASHIYLFDYVDCFKYVPVPFPNFDAQDRGLQFLIENGVTGVHMLGCFYGHGSLGELKSWLYAKKLWNPEWPQHELIEEFVASYYGPAAGEIAEYVALQRRVWADFYRNRKPGTGLDFSKVEIEKMYTLLNSALGHCNKQPEYAVKIERELLTLLCLSLSVHPRLETAADYSVKLKQAEKLIGRADRHLKLKGKKYFGEVTTIEETLIKWHRKLNRVTEGNGLPQYSKNSVTLDDAAYSYVAGGLTPKYLPDAEAALGHASRQAGGNREWSFKWPYRDFIDLLEPGKVYVVRMRAKPEFKKAAPQARGTLFTFGSYTRNGANAGIHSRRLTANLSANDDGKYRWIELGRLQIDNPKVVGVIYCVPGKDLTKDDAVWYDYLEFVPEDEFKDAELAAKLPLIKI